jgi:hypothetical protein
MRLDSGSHGIRPRRGNAAVYRPRRQRNGERRAAVQTRVRQGWLRKTEPLEPARYASADAGEAPGFQLPS